jgi:hypothetical protein
MLHPLSPQQQPRQLIEQHILDTNAGRQQSQACTDV